ncbi:alkaline phosphatase family protein [Acidipila sp. 4G-K13]|uniref:Nucleotide pyrophosphatase n=2 Tax=Paracidobacterium acidisoli TaxID=2303751 RepID=A0A372IKV8_9BACT|nr:alkaline phosphatase family protein [Paracidobacterium acidisoli]
MFLTVFALAGAMAQDRDQDHDWERSQIRHVLLISIDGMHAVDYLNCTQGIAGVNSGQPYCPSLAALGSTGVNYTAASTSKPSDSFPGLMTIVSGATPRTMGVYYDVAYDRSLDAPAVTTGNGVASGTCKAGGAPTGSTTEFDEGIDIDQTKLNGGAPGAGLTDGGIASIDVQRLDRDPKTGCAPVYPWNFVRTNTIFGVIHAAGGYTAWSDKHPSYSSVSGPGGTSLDDYYSPEINSTVVALPGVTTPSGIACSTIPDSSQTGAWTDSFQNIQCYDTLKVNAVVREIEGKNHNGHAARVPTILGMNFQAVSVGEKLIEANVATGGYKDAQGTPTASLLSEIEFVDDSIGEMVQELKDRGLYESTLVVITAKHGQSPIDPNRYFPIPGHSGNNGTTPATLIASLLPTSESPLNPTGIGATEDDVSLLWLINGANTQAAVDTLEGSAAKAGIGQIYYGPSLALNYNTPGLAPNGDPRTPDIIVTPNVGVTYTGSTAKLSEHGGFSHDDTNVMLLLSNPAFRPHTVFSGVATAQVAPTILKALGLDPRTLDGVRMEGTPVLPDVNLNFSW